MTSRCVKIIFTASVLLNLLLAGSLAGMIVDKANHKPWEDVKQNLAPETQNVLARTFQQSSRNMSDTIGKMRNAREEMKKIFSAEQFDQQAYDKAVKDMMDAQEKLMNERMRASKEIAAQLPQTEREKIADQFSKPWGGPRKPGDQRPFDHPKKPGDTGPDKDQP